MLITFYLTVVCNRCEGKGWTPDQVPLYNRPYIVHCLVCNGLGLKRIKKTFVCEDGKIIEIQKKKIIDEFADLSTEIARFKKRHPERWQEIKKKSRHKHREKYNEYMRNYLKIYKAKKKNSTAA